MAAGAITIGLEKFMLTPDLGGSINHQPLTVFRDQYGIEMTDTATLDLFKRVFASGLAKDARAERIAQLTTEQKDRILVALNKRLGLFTRNLATLQNTTLENKRVALNKLIHDITQTGAKSPGTVTPSGTPVVLNEIVETVASPENTPEVAQEKKTKRANFLQRILIIAYYLANPSKLRALDQSVFNSLSDLVAGLNGVKTPSQLTNILALIQAGAKAEDVRALDPLNYFEMISMPGFLESSDLETGVQNKVITPLTNESLLSSYIAKLMGLLAIQGTVDEERIKAFKECLKGKGACIDKGKKEKGEQLAVKLTSAIEPLYETFRKMYNPLFSVVTKAMEGIRPKPFDPIMNMLKLFARPGAEVVAKGVYKYTGVPKELMELVRKLHEQYGVAGTPLRELKVGEEIQYVYLPENLPIPRTVAQMRFGQIQMGGDGEGTTVATGLVLEQAKAASEEAKRRAESAKATTVATGLVLEQAKAASAKATKRAESKTPLTEEIKQQILTITSDFFTSEDDTLYIVSGGPVITVPFHLFTVSNESMTPVSVPVPGNVKVTNILPDITRFESSKPIGMGAFMLAGFIAFKEGLSEMTKEAEPTPEPVPTPVL